MSASLVHFGTAPTDCRASVWWTPRLFVRENRFGDVDAHTLSNRFKFEMLWVENIVSGLLSLFVNSAWVRIYFGIFFRFVLGFFFFSFFVRASKMSYFTAFSREIDAFYTSSSTSPASFSTSPACPTNIPSITNKSWVTKSKNVAGGLTGSKQ